MRKNLLCFVFVVLVAYVGIVRAQFLPSPPPPPLQIGFHPFFGPMHAGSVGPVPSENVRRFQLIQHIANGIQLQQIGFDQNVGPICNGHLGPGPCDAVLAYILQAHSGIGQLPQGFNPRQPWLLPEPKPIQVVTIGGKRICLPWC